MSMQDCKRAEGKNIDCTVSPYAVLLLNAPKEKEAIVYHSQVFYIFCLPNKQFPLFTNVTYNWWIDGEVFNSNGHYVQEMVYNGSKANINISCGAKYMESEDGGQGFSEFTVYRKPTIEEINPSLSAYDCVKRTNSELTVEGYPESNCHTNDKYFNVTKKNGLYNVVASEILSLSSYKFQIFCENSMGNDTKEFSVTNKCGKPKIGNLDQTFYEFDCTQEKSYKLSIDGYPEPQCQTNDKYFHIALASGKYSLVKTTEILTSTIYNLSIFCKNAVGNHTKVFSIRNQCRKPKIGRIDPIFSEFDCTKEELFKLTVDGYPKPQCQTNDTYFNVTSAIGNYYVVKTLEILTSTTYNFSISCRNDLGNHKKVFRIKNKCKFPNLIEEQRLLNISFNCSNTIKFHAAVQGIPQPSCSIGENTNFSIKFIEKISSLFHLDILASSILQKKDIELNLSCKNVLGSFNRVLYLQYNCDEIFQPHLPPDVPSKYVYFLLLIPLLTALSAIFVLIVKKRQRKVSRRKTLNNMALQELQHETAEVESLKPSEEASSDNDSKINDNDDPVYCNQNILNVNKVTYQEYNNGYAVIGSKIKWE